MSLINLSSQPRTISREFKQDVYGRRQMEMANGKDYFCLLFFSSNPQTNPWHTHSHKQKELLLFTANTNIFTVLYRQMKKDRKTSFIFAVCRLVDVTSCWSLYCFECNVLIPFFVILLLIDTGCYVFKEKKGKFKKWKGGLPEFRFLYLDVREGSL